MANSRQSPGLFTEPYRYAASDEPLFVLTARDVHAPTIVETWASLKEADAPNIAREARQLADDMRKWRLSREG
jgi:hypothetical protein